MTATSPTTTMMEKSYPFPFWSGFFEKKHYKAMGGGPVFLFGYLINKTTKENCTMDGNVGVVLGGKPIRDKEIAKHYAISLTSTAVEVISCKKAGGVLTKWFVSRARFHRISVIVTKVTVIYLDIIAVEFYM